VVSRKMPPKKTSKGNFKGGKATTFKSKPSFKAKKVSRPSKPPGFKSSAPVGKPKSMFRAKRLGNPKKLTSHNNPKHREAIHGIANSVGDAIGSIVHPLAGKAFKWFANLVGNGSYKVGSPGMKIEDGTSPPVFRKSAHGFIVEHREYVQDIYGSILFNNNSYQINPVNSTLFPWLSLVAQNFEEYRILGMVMEFKSMSADALNSVNTALGTVIMAAEYNALDANFDTKVTAENYEWAVSMKPSESCIYPLECAPAETPTDVLYIQEGALPIGADLRLYNWANFQLMTTGMQAAANIGELWVSYSIELLKPRITPGTIAPSWFSATSTNLPASSYTIAANNVFGTSGFLWGPSTTTYQTANGRSLSVGFATSQTDIRFTNGSAPYINGAALQLPANCAGRSFRINLSVSSSNGGSFAPVYANNQCTFTSPYVQMPDFTAGVGMPLVPNSITTQNSQINPGRVFIQYSCYILAPSTFNSTTGSVIFPGPASGSGTVGGVCNCVLEIIEIASSITGSGLQAMKREPLVPVIQRLMELERRLNLTYNAKLLKYEQQSSDSDSESDEELSNVIKRMSLKRRNTNIITEEPASPESDDPLANSVHLSKTDVKSLLMGLVRSGVPDAR